MFFNTFSIYISFFLYRVLGFIIEVLALTIGIDRLHPAKALGNTSWVVTQRNL